MVFHYEVIRDERGNIGLYLTNLKSIKSTEKAKIEHFLLNPEMKLDILFEEDGNSMCIRIS